MVTPHVLLVGLVFALAACSEPKPAPEQADGWSAQLSYHAALLPGSRAGSCTEVDAYTGACVAY
jgi:hypothetical protein